MWQAHQIWDVSALYCTVQSRCVHTALKALNSPSLVRTRMAGFEPNFSRAPELGLNSVTLPATTLSVMGSASVGGTM